jgi:VWFA-related protein
MPLPFSKSALVLPLALLSLAAFAQSDIPKFTSSSELVLVPAVVTDKSGNHIPSLPKDRFVVLEDGKPQQISVFEEIQTAPTRIQRTLASNGQFTNVLQPGSKPQRLVIVALDLVNTPALLQANARNELLKFLGQALDPGEPTELVAIGRNGLIVLHDFTEDPAVLAAALKRTPDNGSSLTDKQSVSQAPHDGSGLAAMLRMLAQLENEEKAKMEAFDRQTAILATLQALKQIAASVAGVPGRKALLWVSAGFPFSISQADTAPPLGSALDTYEHTWRLLNQAQVAVYPVDVRALTNYKFHGADEPGTKHMPWESAGTDPYTDILMRDDNEQQETFTTLQNFASATGGKAFFDSNDLQRGFKEAVKDNSSYYMLGYYLNLHGKKPGWHKLKVQVQEHGAEVRARNAFFVAGANEKGNATRDDLVTALRSPVDFTAVPIQGSWLSLAQDGGKKKATFELVMPAGFADIDDGDNNHMHVEFVAEAKTENAQPVRVTQTLDVHLDAKGLDQIRNNGMTYHNALKLPPGDYTVRFVVLDALSGRMGSVAAELKVQ